MFRMSDEWEQQCLSAKYTGNDKEVARKNCFLRVFKDYMLFDCY